MQKRKEEIRNNLLSFLFAHFLGKKNPNYSLTFKIIPGMEIEDAPIQEHWLAGFTAERSDFHECKWKASP